MNSSAPIVLEGWHLKESVRLDRPLRTPLGGSVTLLSCCVDIRYEIREDTISILAATLCRDSRSDSAVTSTQTGEMFDVRRLPHEADLVDATRRELARRDELLQRKMRSLWKNTYRTQLTGHFIEAINTRESPAEIGNRLRRMIRDEVVCFGYRKEDGTASLRTVIPRSVSRGMLHAEDVNDGGAKWFRFDRIYEAKTYSPSQANPEASRWKWILSRTGHFAFVAAHRLASVVIRTLSHAYKIIAPRIKANRDAQIILATVGISVVVILFIVILMAL